MEEKIKLKRLLEELEKCRARKTELISFYLPPEYDINAALSQISQEIATAKNIKLDSTRKNVIAALEKIASILRETKKIGKNGLVIFAGNVDNEVKSWVIEPPEPLNLKIYRCDQKFLLDPLYDLLKEKEIYGLITLDAKEVTIGLLKGSHIESVYNAESNVPSKTVKGGWSQARYRRIREQALHEWLKKIGEIASKIFLENNVVGILIGGPGPVKEDFVRGEFLDYRLRDKIIAIKDVGYTNEYGLEELVRRSEKELENTKLMKERKILKEFFQLLNEKSILGLENVLKMGEINNLEKVIINEEIKIGNIKFFCEKCNYSEEFFGILKEKNCPKCNSKMKILNFEDKTDEIVEKLKEKAEIFYVSSKTQEGEQFLNLGGIGAIVKFKVF